jgi:hypothetical protein
MEIRAPEKRSKLLEVLVDSTPIHILALALACKSRSNFSYTKVLLSKGDEAFRHAFEATLEYTFPTAAAQFANSLAQRAIKKLDSIYALLPTSDFTRSLHEHRCAGLQVEPVFEALKGIIFHSPVSLEIENSEGQIFASRQKSQKQAKRARARGPSIVIDETPFQRMRVSRPRSQSECNKLIEDLLVGQKEILQVCTPNQICAPLMNCKEFYSRDRTSRSTGIFYFQYCYQDCNRTDHEVQPGGRQCSTRNRCVECIDRGIEGCPVFWDSQFI